MTQEEIIELAKSINEDWWLDDIDLQTFAKLVAEAEREACAKDAEWCIQNNIEQHIPTRIRARGET